MTPDEFRKMRKATRLTQAQMGARLGYSRQAVIAWEANDHAIPDDVLDKLIERSLAPNPEPAKPVLAGTHPELFHGPKGYRTANHKHPYWWRYSTRVGHFVALRFGQAERDRLRNLPTYPADIGTVEWTPARAVAFIVGLGAPEKIAKDIAREIGFDIPPDSSSDYLRAHNDYLLAHGTLAGFSHPDHPQAAPIEYTGPTPEIGALDDFQIPGILTPNPKD
jgi:DNA-binding XRE family transcriptional regulator